MKHNLTKPPKFQGLLTQSKAINFTMSSDAMTGSLLRSLTASKPSGNILEIGTGTGLGLSWILDGANSTTSVTSVENDRFAFGIARSHFDDDPRVNLICIDAGEYIQSYKGQKFDLIFADAWPGKFHLLEETLSILTVGGIYVIDDLIEQSTWPDGHAEKVVQLKGQLDTFDDLSITHLDWSTGLIIATKTH